MSTIPNTVAVPADLEANKALVLRLAEAFNDHRLDLLKRCFTPSSAGAESQPSRRSTPRSVLVLGEGSTRCSIKHCPTRESRC